MGKFFTRKRKKTIKYVQWMAGGISVLFVFVCYQNMSATGDAPAMGKFLNFIREEIAVSAWKNCMPVMVREEEEGETTLGKFLLGKIEEFYPVYAFSGTLTEYDTQIESDLTCGMLEENQEANQEQQEEPKEQQDEPKEQEEQEEQEEQQGQEEQEEQQTEGEQEVAANNASADSKAVEVSREKLNDFDYLVQNFYQIDRTTTIDGSELNAQEMLAKDMRLQGGAENIQILIYHTHSQEGYADSTPGDPNSSVLALGERLTQLLRDQYGFNVLHHMGEYDVKDRDNAYSYAGPALEQLLAENPSIEVVIDLHRDGVPDTAHLVSEVNGKQTAQIMFFNGLSRTTANGNIAHLANPNLADNLAFSFQMKLAAEEYYPGFARATYLKGYRYNLHYRPKSLLVEVGAQTNTLEEAMNAMEPLADILHKVLSP